jgi:hypothetical protein
VEALYVDCFLLMSELLAHIGRSPKKTEQAPAALMCGPVAGIVLPVRDMLIDALASPAMLSSWDIQADSDGAEEDPPSVILKESGLQLILKPPVPMVFLG